MKIFSEKLKRMRESKNYSQAEMARYLGVSPSSYSTYENGREEIGDREPSFNTLLKIATLLNVSLDELMGFRRNDFEHYKSLWQKAGYDISVENNQITINSKKESPKNEIEKNNFVDYLLNNGGFICTKEDFINMSRQAENETIENVLPLIEKNNILNLQNIFRDKMICVMMNHFEQLNANENEITT